MDLDLGLGLVLNGSSARQDLELARRAEEAGFDSVYSVEFFNRNALVRLAAISQVTDRVRIGSAIANTFTRSPPLLASAALDIDELSGGRFVLGLGSGTQRMNEEWYGVPFAKPATRTRELVELLRKIWRSGDGLGFEWQGEHWRLRIPAYTRPDAVRQDIPIWVAAVNRGMIRTAGLVANGMVGHPIHSRKWHREVTLPLLEESEEKAGRERGACPLFPYVIVSIQEDREQAIRDAKRAIGFSFSVELYHPVLEIHGLEQVGHECRKALPTFDLQAMAEAVPDSLVDEIAVACTPDEAAQRLDQWSDLTSEPMLYPASIGTSAERLRRNYSHIFDGFGRRDAANREDGTISATDP